MIARRGFLSGITAFLAAPAIIRTPGLLMPVRPAIILNEVEIDFFVDDESITRFNLYNHRVYQEKAGAWYMFDESRSEWAQWNQPLPWDRSG